MSKSSIKAVIDAAIKQNGTKSITGPVLNSVLNQMVDEVPDVVNDKTTGGAGKAWSAEQGKDLSADVSQLSQKVDDLSTGKYYGYFAKEEDLPCCLFYLSSGDYRHDYLHAHHLCGQLPGGSSDYQ